MFQFIPDQGVINVGEQLVIEVIFNPDVVRVFRKAFSKCIDTDCDRQTTLSATDNTGLVEFQSMVRNTLS
jgi:hypothetical protein